MHSRWGDDRAAVGKQGYELQNFWNRQARRTDVTDQADVPIIDIARLAGDGRNAKRSIAEEIDRACRSSGFFYAANHGIDFCALQRVTTDLHRSVSDDEKWSLAVKAYNPSNPRVRNGYYMGRKGKKTNEYFCYSNPSFN